ncbi:hypothetical protein P692DRAFT_20880296 [Suillus brevipes Sb2]|nr:hypothetical protein P692DRAFT_20880296 [Suillus brevipes Sb2]
MNGREAPSQRSSLYAPAHPEGGRSQIPQSYVASPVPSGVSYPAPPISREPTPNGSAHRGDRSSTHEPQQSSSQMAGMAPGAHSRSLQPLGGGATPRSCRKCISSNLKIASRYNFTGWFRVYP